MCVYIHTYNVRNIHYMYATYFNFLLPSLRPYIWYARVECPTGPTLVTALPIGTAARQAPERCWEERVEEYTSA